MIVGYYLLSTLYVLVCLLLLLVIMLQQGKGDMAAAASPDLPGSVVFALAVSALVLGVVKGEEWGWTDPRMPSMWTGWAASREATGDDRSGRASRSWVRSLPGSR